MTTSPKSPQRIDKSLGQRIRQRRRALGLTQAALGVRIGVTFQQIQKYGSGMNRITVSRLVGIAKALETPLGWFLYELG